MGLRQFVLNLGLAVVWLLLQADLSLVNLAGGYLLGAVVIWVLTRTTGQPFYLHRVFAGLELLLVFVYEVIVANLRMAYQILHPRLPVRPGFIALPLELRTDGQITLLAIMVTMTPGTLSVEVTEDRRYLVVHVLDLDDPEATGARIKRVFEQRVLEVAP
jgi:multicomponent Na+:H+ antiporter subunit E